MSCVSFSVGAKSRSPLRVCSSCPSLAEHPPTFSRLAEFPLPHSTLLAAGYFQSPFHRGDYNGSEKLQTACHADLLLRFMVDGSVAEGDLWRMFKDSSLFPSKAGKKSTNRVRVPNPARKLFAANLHQPPVPLAKAETMTNEEWKEVFRGARWSVFYTEYVVPLARLSRLLRQATTTRATDQHALEIGNQYVRGMRLVFGVDYMHHKTIVHRMYHLLLQPQGR